MCIVFSIIEYVYWCLGVIFIEYVRYWEFVCELSEIPWLFVLLCHIYFVREMSNLLLRSLSHCHFHNYIHYWCDFTSCLISVDHHISSYIHCSAVIFIVACVSSHSLHVLFSPYSNPSQVRYSLCIIITHIIISSFCFICLLIDIIFTLGILRSMAHEIHYTCYISFMRAWFSDHRVFEPSFLSFLLPITLAYVTSRVLRPSWGHGIRCHFWQPLLGQVFEIWLTFRYHHVSSSGSRLFDV